MPATVIEAGGTPLVASRAHSDRAGSQRLGEVLFAFRSVVEVVRHAGASVCDSTPPYSDATVDGTVVAVLNVLFDQPVTVPTSEIETRKFIRAVRQELLLSRHVRSDLVPTQDLRRLMDALDSVSDASSMAATPTVNEPELHASEHVLAAVHDLRSPLTSILLLVDSLRSQCGGPITEVQRRQLNLVYDAALGLSISSTNLMDALRFDGPGGTGAQALQAVPFSIAEVMYGVRDILMPVAEERGITISLQLPRTDARVGHPTLLSRVLLNLASNALRETQKGMVELAIEEEADYEVCYRVSDTGPGMDSKALASLFKPVQHSHSQPHEWLASAGIGLVICRRMAEAMGGKLSAESTPGGGTTFYCRVKQPAASDSESIECDA